MHDKLLALSKSMGHSLLANTLYYYSLVPKLHKTTKELSGAKFNQLIPDLQMKRTEALELAKYYANWMDENTICKSANTVRAYSFAVKLFMEFLETVKGNGSLG